MECLLGMGKSAVDMWVAPAQQTLPSAHLHDTCQAPKPDMPGMTPFLMPCQSTLMLMLMLLLLLQRRNI